MKLFHDSLSEMGVFGSRTPSFSATCNVDIIRHRFRDAERPPYVVRGHREFGERGIEIRTEIFPDFAR
jgi:hypothetical protein